MKIFKLPDLGEGMQEAEIIEWHVKEGDEVRVDQPLVSMETDKAIVEVPACGLSQRRSLCAANDRARRLSSFARKTPIFSLSASGTPGPASRLRLRCARLRTVWASTSR